jgi:4'-phosphopantetheinyl transferase EntD
VATPPFSIAFADPHPFGFLVGVTLAIGRRPVTEEVLARLDAREVTFARSLGSFRQIQWVGGRLAARAAGAHFGAGDGWAVDVGAAGAPVGPHGFTVSIAHKAQLAIALVSPVDRECLGVDLEDDDTAAREIQDSIFSPRERSDLGALPHGSRPLVLGFALKEATYKAFATRVGRVLGYDEARVGVDSRGGVTLTTQFRDVSPQPDVEVAWESRASQVIAAVREKRG